MKLVKATDAHYLAMFGEPVPSSWFGYALLDDASAVMGIGLCWWAVDQRWWGGVAAKSWPAVPRVMAHRAALDALAFARDQGIVVHALCDMRFPRARAWLERLGFEETAEVTRGGVVWTR